MTAVYSVCLKIGDVSWNTCSYKLVTDSCPMAYVWMESTSLHTRFLVCILISAHWRLVFTSGLVASVFPTDLYRVFISLTFHMPRPFRTPWFTSVRDSSLGRKMEGSQNCNKELSMCILLSVSGDWIYWHFYQYKKYFKVVSREVLSMFCNINVSEWNLYTYERS
jgi:hypothetical protein